MSNRQIRYLGYAISAVAGILVAVDVLPKVIVLLLGAVGVLLIFIGDRADRPTV